MRSKHTLSALLASALLFAGAGSALAASVQIVLPEETVPGGSRAQLTVTTDVPGFLTLTLDGPSGSVTLCENQEVHTADNTLIFTVSDEDGAPLDVGAYTVNGELIDQFLLHCLTIIIIFCRYVNSFFKLFPNFLHILNCSVLRTPTILIII